MGIDAEIIIKRRGEKPTEDQLTRWSWDIGSALGAKKFFIQDGLPRAEYKAARQKWLEAFNAHPLHPEYEKRTEGAHDKILADLGPAPACRRLAIDLTCAGYAAEDFDDDKVPVENRAPGRVYFEDSYEPVLAAPGEWLLQVSVFTRYYGEGYERGDILFLCAVAEWVEANIPNCEVWYGGDSSGVCIEPFGEKRRAELRKHLYSSSGRDYFKHSGPDGSRLCPKPCSLCVPGENRFQQFGFGSNYCAVSCGGCGKNFETRDNGVTWITPQED